MGMLQSSTNVASTLKKKALVLCYHKIRECVAASIIQPVKVLTNYNIADAFTKALAWKEFHYHSGVFYGRWLPGAGIDMNSVKL